MGGQGRCPPLLLRRMAVLIHPCSHHPVSFLFLHFPGTSPQQHNGTPATDERPFSPAIVGARVDTGDVHKDMCVPAVVPAASASAQAAATKQNFPI